MEIVQRKKDELLVMRNKLLAGYEDFQYLQLNARQKREKEVIDEAKNEPRKVRMNLAFDSEQLGKVILNKSRSGPYKKWEDGYAYVDIQEEIEKVKNKWDHYQE
jgi:hypothetical protein